MSAALVGRLVAKMSVRAAAVPGSVMRTNWLLLICQSRGEPYCGRPLLFRLVQISNWIWFGLAEVNAMLDLRAVRSSLTRVDTERCATLSASVEDWIIDDIEVPLRMLSAIIAMRPPRIATAIITSSRVMPVRMGWRMGLL